MTINFARELPLPEETAKAIDTFQKVKEGGYGITVITGSDLVVAIRAGVGVKYLGKIICDPRYNKDWIVFMEDEFTQEITFQVIYSAAKYNESFIRRIVALVESGYRDQWKPEIQLGPEDVNKTLLNESTS